MPNGRNSIAECFRRSPRAIFAACVLTIATAALAAWWWYESRTYLVEIYLESGREHRLERWPDFNSDQVKSEPVASVTPWFKFHAVINEALRDSKIASLPAIAKKSDPVHWISRAIEIEAVRIKYKDPWGDFFVPHRSAHVVRFRARRADADDLRQLLDALAIAYNEVFVYPEIQRRLIIRDALVHSIQRIDEDAHRLEGRDTGDTNDGGIAGAGAQAEIKRLQSIRESMSRQVEQMEVENQDPGLYPIRPAEIRPE